MKVGSRADYGLRALVYLASLNPQHAAGDAKPVQIHAIAERQSIPEDYLRQLLVLLKEAGLVRSVRGPHGGYLLARDPGSISMAAVLEVLEGPPEKMRCSFNNGSSPKHCSIVGGCTVRHSFQAAQDAMQRVLTQTTLRQLAQQQRESDSNVAPGQPATEP